MGLQKLLLLGALFLAAILFSQSRSTTIISSSPATHFTESMPLGNGRLGAMVFGDPDKERIVLNEISLWSGGPQDADRDSAYIYLKPIQNLLLEGKNKDAQELLLKHFISKGDGSGLGRGREAKFGSYQTAGNLFIDWKTKDSKITNYSSSLDIENAVATTEYQKDGNCVKQEVFTDFKNDVIWLKISAEKPLGDFEISLDRKENVISNLATNSTLILHGQLPAGKDKGMKYLLAAKIIKTNGKTTANTNVISVSGATELVLAIDILTNYDHDKGDFNLNSDLKKLAEEKLTKIQNYNFENAKNVSTAIYKSYFNRTNLKLAEQKNNGTALTTRQRLVDFGKGAQDPELLELYFNFGKYLLISSSRPGLLPANLQGLWAEEYQAPWNGDYHLNINVQMNYWPAEVLNLSDLAEPLFRFSRNLMTNGQKTAQKYYGAKGWVAHVISNPWFFTSPGESADWGSTLTGGAWLSTHIWEHYRFTQDKKFLKNYYPVLKSSAEFLKDILIEEPKNKWLVTAPSNSPENTYIMPNGFEGNTVMGPTMDMQITRNLFSGVAASTKILKTDEKFGEDLAKISQRLVPNQISKDGGIQEWLADWPSAEPHHRHVSHLFGLYPYDEISAETPELFKAAKQTLIMRGDGGTGWSKAWKINFWARLQDGDHAYTMLKNLLTPVYFGARSGGGTYPNLFDAHPPFQIDGNFGATTGIAEMLLQSHGKNKIIRLLPALPSDESFSEGKFTGFKARNNFEISCSWKNFKVENAEIISESGRILRLLLPADKSLQTISGKILAEKKSTERIVEVKTKKNQKLILK